MSIVILGDGLLGKELAIQTNWDVLSRKKDVIDFDNLSSWSYKLLCYDIIVNCIAFTKTYENNREESWSTNVEALDQLIDYCNKTSKKLVHISTDYVYAGSEENCSEEGVPVHNNSFYGYTKLVGDALVQLRCNDYLICRLSHKPNPFPYEKAWSDVQTNCDYVDVIAGLVVKLITNKSQGVFNVGTETKSIYELALKTNKEVGLSTRPPQAPQNTTMDLTKLNNFLKGLT
jgi:dTDP-4-dehydrorhamnose reductase